MPVKRGWRATPEHGGRNDDSVRIGGEGYSMSFPALWMRALRIASIYLRASS